MRKVARLTEDESEIFDLMGLLLRRGGIRIGVPILVGAVLVAIGLGALSRGWIVESLIAIAVGVVLIVYGIYELNRRREDIRKKKDSL
jgi:uncharacterized membrane protein YfcA